MLGRIHSYESGGMLDGPGIRLVVFFSGCPMRCIYCHNPDTWDPGSGKLTDHTEVLEKACKLKPYYKSTGGITLSGGEPLMQAEFALEIFKACKLEGIHTVLDTSGAIVNNHVIKLMEYTDLILLDIKHTDPIKFHHITGYNNSPMLKFLDIANLAGIDTYVRQVIVPTINDDPENVLDLKMFCSNYRCIKKIELLPYHTMGTYKWERLKKDYLLKGVSECSEEKISQLRALL